jgi:hypothetical protein
MKTSHGTLAAANKEYIIKMKITSTNPALYASIAQQNTTVVLQVVQVDETNVQGLMVVAGAVVVRTFHVVT